jgi:hypothetical protein
VCFLFAPELIEQAALATFGAVTLPGFQYSFPPQIMKGTTNGGLGQFQFSGDGRDSRPALTVLVGMIGKVH